MWSDAHSLCSREESPRSRRIPPSPNYPRAATGHVGSRLSSVAGIRGQQRSPHHWCAPDISRTSVHGSVSGPGSEHRRREILPVSSIVPAFDQADVVRPLVTGLIECSGKFPHVPFDQVGPVFCLGATSALRASAVVTETLLLSQILIDAIPYLTGDTGAICGEPRAVVSTQRAARTVTWPFTVSIKETQN